MVLEWNEPGLKFYDSLGAELLGEWETTAVEWICSSGTRRSGREGTEVTA